MNPRQLALFCAQSAVLLRSGRTVSHAVQRAASQADGELTDIIGTVLDQIESGIPLSTVLAPFRGRFPPLFLPVLEAGEASGTVDQSFDRMAHAFGTQAGFEATYHVTVFDPRIALPILLIGALMLSWLNGFANLLLLVLRMVVAASLLLLLVRAGFPILSLFNGCRLFLDRIKLALPYVNTVTRNVAGVRWARSFTVLYRSGVPISEALEISSRSVLNLYYERALLKAAAEMRGGGSFADSLAHVELLPSHMLPAIDVGEKSGRLEQTVGQLADALEKEALHSGRQALMVTSVSAQILIIMVLLASSQ